jgi:hypothetical protein
LYLAVNGFELNETEGRNALAAGADINWQNDAMGGETMLIMAIKGFKEAKVVRFLVDNGARRDIKDGSGKTALDWARQYNIAKDRNGREIMALLEGAAPKTPQATGPTKPTLAGQPAGPIRAKSAKGPPSAAEVKAVMEASFTGIYQSHFYGVKNLVTFVWTGGITIGGIQSVRSAPKPCYPVKLEVAVTAEDPRDGNRSKVIRGMNSTAGAYANETFCFYRDGFGDWNYGTYGK